MNGERLLVFSDEDGFFVSGVLSDDGQELSKIERLLDEIIHASLASFRLQFVIGRDHDDRNVFGLFLDFQKFADGKSVNYRQ